MLLLYSYWRSSCSWRVRIALHLKGIPFEIKPINLLKGEQSSNEYLKINPSGAVPCLIASEEAIPISQSIGIVEYLEEKFPQTKELLPSEMAKKISCKQIMNIVACDIQPLGNLRVLNKISELGADKKVFAMWAIRHGFKIIEGILTENGSKDFCIGDFPTLADAFLIPQVYNALRWDIEVAKEFPKIFHIYEHCNSLPEFKAAHPLSQPDAVAE